MRHLFLLTLVALSSLFLSLDVTRGESKGDRPQGTVYLESTKLATLGQRFRVIKQKRAFHLELPSVVAHRFEPLAEPFQEASLQDFRASASTEEAEDQSRVSFDIPIEINEKVERFINYFQNNKQGFFSRSLARSKKYLPMMKEIFRKNELPEDLVYLALVESGYNTHAASPAKAVGIWQFIAETGRRYGLMVNRWTDERRDPEKATWAAARYLKDLYKMFDSWQLAMAAYNAGEAKIMKGIRNYKTTDFWELSRWPLLRDETKDFVPKMFAATLMAKEPERYGFAEPDDKKPLEYKTVTVPPRTSLKAVAKATQSNYDDILSLNPALTRGVTPPDRPGYQVNIPSESKEDFDERLLRAVDKDSDKKEKVVRSETSRQRPTRVLKRARGQNYYSSKASGPQEKVKRYRVQRGDSLGELSEKWGVSVKEIVAANRGIRPKSLRVGATLIIPEKKG